MLKVLVRLGVSAALLYFVLRSIDLPSFWERVKGMNPAWILLALAAYAFTQSIAVWRWNRLLRAQHIEVERRRLTESIWVSMFFNNFLPSNIGGDVVRIADTAPAAGSKTLATTVILVDRVLGLTALVIVAASGALVASLLGVHVPGARWLWMASALGAVAAISVIAMPQLVGHALMPVRALNKPWLTERAQRLEDAVIRFRNAPVGTGGRIRWRAGGADHNCGLLFADCRGTLSSFANLPGRGAHSGEPRGPDGAGLDQRVRCP